MVRLQDLPEELQQQLSDERRQRSAHARAVVDACARGDAERFYELTDPFDDHPDFWPLAIRFIAGQHLRGFARDPRGVSTDLDGNQNGGSADPRSRRALSGTANTDAEIPWTGAAAVSRGKRA